MDLILLRVFQLQVQRQCEFMLLAASEIDRAVAQKDTVRVFYGVQNLLSAAANISKALWGQRGRLSAQRKELRDSIGVSDASPLREVTMRNNYEHFDERLDRWWKESARHNYADFSIGPRSAIVGMDDIDMFRTFDPGTAETVFWNQAFNLRILVTEVRRILPMVAREAAKPHWPDGRNEEHS